MLVNSSISTLLSLSGPVYALTSRMFVYCYFIYSPLFNLSLTVYCVHVCFVYVMVEGGVQCVQFISYRMQNLLSSFFTSFEPCWHLQTFTSLIFIAWISESRIFKTKKQLYLSTFNEVTWRIKKKQTTLFSLILFLNALNFLLFSAHKFLILVSYIVLLHKTHLNLHMPLQVHVFTNIISPDI